MRERKIRGVMGDRNSRKKDGVHTNRNRDQETVETRRVREGREWVGSDVVVCVSVVGNVANLKTPDKIFPNFSKLLRRKAWVGTRSIGGILDKI